MQMLWINLVLLYTLTNCKGSFILISRTYSIRLYKYVEYYDASLLHYKLPSDISLASFQFRAKLHEVSVFKCEPEDITLYLKYGSPPVINPDNSSFPNGFVNINRPKSYMLQFQTDNTNQFLNITAPESGSYFVVAFISYTDPKQEGIKQQGLAADCRVYLNGAVYVKMNKKTPTIVALNKNLNVVLAADTTNLYKFFVPEVTNTVILFTRDINFCKNCKELQIKIQPFTIPDSNHALHDLQLTKEYYDGKTYSFRFMAVENVWYYLTYKFKKAEHISLSEEFGQLSFKLGYLPSIIVNKTNETQEHKIRVGSKIVEESDMQTFSDEFTQNSIPFKHSVLSYSQNELFSPRNTYREYTTMRLGYTVNYLFFFKLRTTSGSVTSVLDITQSNIYVIKFQLYEAVDIGGTLELFLTFRTRTKSGNRTQMRQELSDYTVIGCIWNRGKATPTWPNKCIYNKEVTESPIIINSNVRNKTVYIPYPESGDWYMTFKLFCGNLKRCNCLDSCEKQYQRCFSQCEITCENFTSCDLCTENCRQSVISRRECATCNCEGSYQRSNRSCIARVKFDIDSYPCVGGSCGENGKCYLLLSDGFGYTTCVCYNNYKGWTCADGTKANTSSMIMLELLLLVLSNLMFIPASFEAYRRGYNVEAIVYFGTCFFSTFYHACDAGEDIYSYCLFGISALQFADFFCGLFSIWVTIIAMAYLSASLTQTCHMIGAISLAFFTTVDKTALWVFALPFMTGILIMILSWYTHYQRTGETFPSRRYLFVIFPTGVITVTTGLLVFGFLQTQDNYKYLHSMWHVLMAFTIIILLPIKESFLPPGFEDESVISSTPKDNL